MLVQFILWFSMFTSLSFIMLDSILMIGVFSLMFSLCICYLIGFFFTSWFGAISIIVYVGGLLVMFSYFLAICPNQSTNIKYSPLIVIMVMSILSFSFIDIFYSPDSGSPLTSLDFLYKVDNGLLLIFISIMLLYALLSVVSIVSLSQGPLRPFSN